MIDLLDLTVAAHGRLDRYNQFKTVSAHLGLGGRMWVLKGQEEVMKDPRVRVTVDLHREYASLAPFKLPNQHTAFTPDRVAVETTEGAIIDHRINPRAAFGGHTRETPWDNLHFTGARPPPSVILVCWPGSSPAKRLKITHVI